MGRAALVLLALLMPAAPAAGQALEVADRVTLGAGAGDPVAWAGADGAAAVAWAEFSYVPGRGASGGPGVWAATKAPGRPWRTREIGREKATGLAVHANRSRVTAVAWETVSRAEPLHLAVSFPRRGFFAATAVPLPPGTADAGGASVAVAADGSVAIAYRAGERGDAPSTAVLVVRHPDGTFSGPQVLAGGVVSGPFVRVDGRGRLHALWSASEGRIRRIFVAHGRTSTGLGPAEAVSDDVLDADNRAAPPTLAGNERGDLLAVWSPLAPGATLPSHVVATFRPAGGEWEAPKVLSQRDTTAFRPTAAVGPRGHAVVAWSLAQGIGAATRSPSGGWSRPQSTTARQGTQLAMPVAVRRDGTAASVRRVERFGESERLAAVVRRPGGCFGAERSLSRAGDLFSAPAIAAPPDGRPLVAWAERQAGAWRVRAARLRIDARRAPRRCR